MAKSLPSAPHLVEEMKISSEVSYKCSNRPDIDSFVVSLAENLAFGGAEHILDCDFDFTRFDYENEIEVLKKMTLDTAR